MGLRESPGFGRLYSFGIPWILSSEMSLFNGLHATPGPFLIHAALPPKRKTQCSGRHSIRRSTTLKPAPNGNRWTRRDHGNRHRKGRTGHWDETNAAFAFWQEIVDSAPHFTKSRHPQSLSGQPVIPSPRSVDARLWTSAESPERLAPRPVGPSESTATRRLRRKDYDISANASRRPNA